MKRTIELYIAGNRADLDTNGLVLMNYGLTDLQKPSVVKNSFSKQITLPGTPTNDAIFGHIGRADRRTATGFNAGQKTPFDVFNEAGEKILSGYLRLDSVVRSGKIVKSYKVSLFGGLGSFFYALSYDGAGNKKTLADLDYLGNGEADELDFVITKDAVEAAWARIDGWHPDIEQIWDVINFAPQYEGCPEGDFSADKGVVNVANVGLTDNVVDGGNTYKSNNGLTLVNLAQGVDEWAVKDLRSYLQRPVLSMQAFLEAIANPENNGGYEVDLSSIPTNCYKGIWKTLPLIPSMGTAKQESGNYTLTLYNNVNYGTGSYLYGMAEINQSVPASTEVDATIKVCPKFRFGVSGRSGQTIYPRARYTTRHPAYVADKCLAVFAQLVAFDSNDVKIGGSPIHCYTPEAGGICAGLYTPEQIASACSFVPEYAGAGYETGCDEIGIDGITISHTDRSPAGDWASLPIATFKVSASGVSYYKLAVKCYEVYYTRSSRDNHGITIWSDPVIQSVMSYGILPKFYDTSSLTTSTGLVVSDAVQWATTRDWYLLTYTSTSNLRSGAQITKALLLTSKHTPAEYLISYCKEFGFLFVCDEVRKKVKILTRNDFYDTGESVIDLTKRVDRSKDITILPLKMGGKWYDFRAAMAEGEFAAEYKSIYGVDYGIQRVNTGYDFDANAVNLMDGDVYRQAVSKIQHNKYWVKITDGGKFKPSPFLDKNVTYTLWDQATGQAKTFPVPGISTSATLYFYNMNRDYYDYDEVVLRLDLADADGKPVDGEDILVYKNGGGSYSGFKVSDDSAAMMTLNDGKPCWDLSLGEGYLKIPTFCQYKFGVSAHEYDIWFSLNFGLPKEVDIPDSAFDGWNGCMYGRYWRNYLIDLLNTDTKVMRCRVDWSRLDVGPELFRRFFYYEGNIWVLNKISNYSLTTWDPAECEFVQVQDMANYMEGQNFESMN